MKTNPLLHSIAILVIASHLGQSTQANAAVITFEDIPGIGAATDGMTINSQFAVDYGVTFSLAGGGFPVLARVGGLQTAFSGFVDGVLTPADRPAPGAGAGAFFLTDDGAFPLAAPFTIIATYSLPVSAASGIILDIDVNERWRVKAMDSSGLVELDFIVLDQNSDGSTVDGSATEWSFDHSGIADIYSIQFLYTGEPNVAVGFALDNFSAPVPEPSSAMLLLSGAILGLRRRSRRTLQPNA